MPEVPELFDNLYDPDSIALQSETKPFDQIIIDAINAALYEVHTWLPAQVTVVNDNGSVNLQPLLQRRFKDGSLKDLPIIQNVPVSMPRGADYWIKLPVAQGDTGVALFCERSLDIWNVSGGIVDPADTRTHDLSDAIFVPGLYPLNAPLPGNADDLVVHNGKAELYVQKNGKFKATNGMQELFDLLDQLMSNYINLMNTLATDTYTLTMLGPQPFIASTVTEIQNLQNTAQQIQTNLETLKGS